MASGHAYSNPAQKTEGLISPWDFPGVASVNHLPESFSATVREGEDTLDYLVLHACLTAPHLKASQTGTMLSPKACFTDGDKKPRDVKIKSIAHVTAQFEGPSFSEFLAKLACSVSNTVSEISVAAMRIQSSCKSEAMMQSHPL